MAKGGSKKVVSASRARSNDARETAAYIATMSAELSALAHRNDLALLSFLLDMATQEAKQNADPKFRDEV
jgi:prophage DNA circulation protein